MEEEFYYTTSHIGRSMANRIDHRLNTLFVSDLTPVEHYADRVQKSLYVHKTVRSVLILI